MIRQFDVIATPGGGRGAELLVVLQSHLLPALDTLLVAPLVARNERPSEPMVLLPISFQGAEYTLYLTQLASIEAKRLDPALGSPGDCEFDIRRGLDRLFTGF